MSVYKFERGPRLFMRGGIAGNGEPPPGVLVTEDESKEVAAVYTHRQLSTELHGSTMESIRTGRKGPLKSVTTRLVKRTTTLTRGTQKTSSEPLAESKPKKEISDIVVDGSTAREALLKWAQRTTDRYPGVRVVDFTKSWRDGLAFNAIIHRHRPDLINWRSLKTRSARERLDTAFTVAEREYAVTRLLDPEDVDTPAPDEKSIITYVSSLYDVFPEPPSLHPLSAEDAEKRLNEYKEFSRRLYIWIHDKINELQSIDIPHTIPEMRKLMAQTNRFRNEELPPRLKDKHTCGHLWREIEKLVGDMSRLGIDEDIRISSIERAWSRLLALLDDREKWIDDEINKHDRWQRLAEKVHREIRQTDSKLDEIEQRVEEEMRRFERLHPGDSKKNCEEIEQDLLQVDDNIRSMLHDCQILLDAHYHEAHGLSKQVHKLRERWSAIHISFQEQLSNKKRLALQAQREPVLSIEKLIETNEHFRYLHECITWVKKKQEDLETAEYGNDLPSVQNELERQKKEHHTIDQFQSKIERCVAAKRNFQGEEASLYSQMLIQLQKAYSELLVTSNKRLSDLETLLDFIQSATTELIWLNEKEEVEVNRDWSSRNLDLVEVEQYYETLMSDLERREIQFNAVQHRGEGLVLQNHPAAKVIEAYMAAMQTQWSWILQLTLCLETHLHHAAAYQRFFSEAQECSQWIIKQEEMLNTVFSKSDFSLEEGEHLMKEMQDLRDDLTRYGDVVQSLKERSREIVPLKQRRDRVARPLPVTAICQYKQMTMTVQKQEECVLHNNSQPSKWRISNSAGVEGEVPGVCFLIPPPNQEAIDTAERLQQAYDHCINLWQKKQHRMRQNMIFATIKVVLSWTFEQYMAMAPEQREAIKRALNEDAEKLISEGDPTDPHLRRLRDEIARCNRLFEEYEERARRGEAAKLNFAEDIATLQSALDDAEQTLKSRCQSNIPRSLDTLETLVIEHKEFESQLQSYEELVERVQETFRELPKKTASQQTRLDKCLEKWQKIWNMSQFYTERMKVLEIVLTDMEEAIRLVADLELKLASSDSMPSDLDSLREASNLSHRLLFIYDTQHSYIHEDLLTVEATIQTHQRVLDQLGEDVRSVRPAVEKSRPNQRRHPDVDRLEEDVKKLTKRWGNVRVQVPERLKSCEAASDMLRKYKDSINTQKSWVNQMEIQMKEANDLEATMNMYHVLAAQQDSIEELNAQGGRFIREAKIYDTQLRQYKASLEDVHPSLDASILKKNQPFMPPGTSSIARELDELNSCYEDLVALAYQKIQHYSSLLKTEERPLQFSIEKVTPIQLRTFRSEFNILESLEMEIDGVNGDTSSRRVRVGDPIIGEQRMSMANVTLQQSANHVPHKKLLISSLANGQGTNGLEGNLSTLSHPPRGTSMQFTEIKSTRRRSEEGVVTDVMTHAPGIFNPKTGHVLSVSEAFADGLLSRETGQFVDPRTNRCLTFSEAITEGYVNSELGGKLLSACGVIDPQTCVSLTLLEAIRKGLYDPDRGSFVNPSTGECVSVQEAVRLGVVLQEKVRDLIQMGIVTSPTMTVTEAVKRGVLDVKTGELLIHDMKLSLHEAHILGYISLEPSAKTSYGISLSDAVAQGIVDESSGQLIDRNSGDRFPLNEAMARGLLNPYICEVFDCLDGQNRLTLLEAVERKLISPSIGRYIDGRKGEYLTFKEAHAQMYLHRPLTLKDVVDMDLVSSNGLIIDPVTKEELSVLEGIAIGLLDSESKSVTDTASQDLVTLAKALSMGLIIPDGHFCDTAANTKLTLPEAAHKGYLTSVAQKVIFDIDGFKDQSTGDYISFNMALQKGLIDSEMGMVVDTHTGKKLSFKDAAGCSLVQYKLYEILSKPIGIRNSKGEELSVLEAVFNKRLDPVSGQVLDRENKKPLPIEEAIAKKLITPEGATFLRSLLNITVTTSTVTKTVKRYVKKFVQQKVTMTEALERGLIDEDRGTFYDEQINSEIPIQNALSQGLLALSSSWQENPQELEKSDSQHASNKSSIEKPDSQQQSLRTMEGKTEGSMPISEVAKKTVPKYSVSSDYDFGSSSLGVQAYEMPAKGWFLKEALALNLFDPLTGLLTIPGSDRLVSFEECIQMGIIDPSSATIMDPYNGKPTTILHSLEKKFVDSTGHYVDRDGRKYSLRDAVQKKYIMLKDRRGDDQPDSKTLRIQHSESQLTTLQTCDKEQQKISKSPIQVSRDVIFYPSEAMVEVLSHGRKMDLLMAVKEGLVQPRRVRVKEPSSNKFIAINDAMRKGFIDKKTGEYKDKTGRRHPLVDATHLGIVMVEPSLEKPETSVIEKGMLATTYKKATVIDPRTKQELSLDEALQKGLIDEDIHRQQVLEGYGPDGEYMEADTTKTIEWTIIVQDPETGDEISAEEAVDRGFLTTDELEVLKKYRDEKQREYERSEPAVQDREQRRPSLGDITRSKVTTEPKFKVAIGRAKSFSAEPVEKQAKARRKAKSTTDAPLTSNLLGSDFGIIDLDSGQMILPLTRDLKLSMSPSVHEVTDTTPNVGMDNPVTVMKHVVLRAEKLNEDSDSSVASAGHDKISFCEAIRKGLVDLEEGTFKNPSSGDVISITSAIDEGILNPSESASKKAMPMSKLTLSQAIQSIYDENKESFLDPKTQELLSFEECLTREVIDPNCVLYLVEENCLLTTKEALEGGILDRETGNFIASATGNKISLEQALKSGLLTVIGVPAFMGKEVAAMIGEQLQAPCSRFPRINNSQQETGDGKEIDMQSSVVYPVLKVPIAEALSQSLIILDTCVLVVPKTNETFSLHNALDHHIVSPESIVDVQNETKMVLIENIPYSVHVIRQLSMENAIEQGSYDPESETFVDDNTGDPITLEEAINLGMFDAELILVKDLRKGVFVPLIDALDLLLIDKCTGHMVDPSTGTRVPFYDAVDKGWIQVSEKAHSPGKPVQPLSLHEVINKKLYDFDTGNIQEPVSGREIPLHEAINMGLVRPDSVLVRDLEAKKLVSLDEALSSGLVDLKHGVYVHSEKGRELELKTAIMQGLITTSKVPMSIEAVIRKGLYNPETGLIRDPATAQGVNIDEAVNRGIVDPVITECLDTSKGETVTLEEALERKLVDPCTGQLKNTTSGELLCLDKALDSGLILTAKFSIPLLDSLAQELYDPELGIWENPATGQLLTLQDALDSKLLDASTVQVKDPQSNAQISLEKALERGIINGKTGQLVHPAPMSLSTAFNEGLLSSKSLYRPLQELLEEGLYDAESGMITLPGSDEKLTLEEAIKRGEVEPSALTVKDPRSGDLLTLQEAIIVGIIHPRHGICTDPVSGADLNLYDALDRRLIVSAKKSFSLPEAVFKGIYDTKSRKFLRLETKEKFTTDRAIRSGLIDPSSTLVKDSKGNLMTFMQAVENAVIDSKDGTVKVGRYNKVDFQAAFDQGLLIEIRPNMSVREAVIKGIYSREEGRFLVPATGKWVDIQEAIQLNLINPNSVHVKDTRSGFLKKMPLNDALNQGFVDVVSGKVKNMETGEMCDLIESFETGLIVDSMAVISLQKALHQGLYDEVTGRFTDPNTGNQITLHEALRRFIINPYFPCFWDKENGHLLSLGATCREGIIDRRQGVFKDPTSGLEISLSEALDQQLIVDIERPLSIYDAISVGLYVPSTGKFAHPTHGRMLTLEEACKEDVLDAERSIIRHVVSGQLLALPEAVAEGLVDSKEGRYVVPGSNDQLTLQQALEQCLIVNSKRPMSIEEMLKNKLYVSETGRFIDPVVGDHLDLYYAVELGLIEPSTSAFRDPNSGNLKSIRSAIEDGDIDERRGTVKDPKLQVTYPVDVAFARGLIVTVEKPITFQQAMRRGSIDLLRMKFRDPRTCMDCSLEEAIVSELIDPESAVIKDPRTGRFKTLKSAIQEGIIDIKKKAMLDPQTGKMKKLCILFEQGTVAFWREPLSFMEAIQKGLLSLHSGSFTDPASEEVLTLQEAIQYGLIDPNSCVVKDTRGGFILNLPEAIRQGLVDPQKGMFYNKATNHLLPLDMAIENGMLLVPERPFSLMEALQYGLFDQETGKFSDPFRERAVTLQEALDSGLIDPTTTVIRDPVSGKIVSLAEAVQAGLLDPITGELIDPSTGKRMSLLDAMNKGFLLTAEARLAMEEKYKLCDDTINKLLAWVGETEKKLATQEPAKENVDKLRNQINVLKQISNDIEEHSRPMHTAVDQMQHIMEEGQEFLSPDEIAQLRRHGDELKQRYESASDHCDQLLKKLHSALDELSKFQSELNTFETWLADASRKLHEKEQALSDLPKLKSHADTTKDLVGDVMAHQADLRFLTMAAQKFLDEGKDHLKTLNAFRTSLPQRYSHIEPSDSQVRRKVADVSTAFQDLLSRANKLSEKFLSVGDKQHMYADCVDRMKTWLKEVEPKASKLVNEPIAAEPKAIQDQLDKVKMLNNDILSQGRLLDSTKQAGKNLLDSLEGSLTPQERRHIDQTMQDLDARYNQLLGAVGGKGQELESALVASQGVSDGIDSVMNWLNQVESQLRTMMKPASLNRDRLNDQLQEQKVLHHDIDAHRPTIQSLAQAATELMASSSGNRTAKKIEGKLRDMVSQYEKLVEKCSARSIFLEDVSVNLDSYSTAAHGFEEWFAELSEILDSPEGLKVDIDTTSSHVVDLVHSRDSKRDDFEDMIRKGKNLVGRKDVTDAQPIKEQIKTLEAQWKELNAILDEKQKLNQSRYEHRNAYEALRDQVLEWMTHMEGIVEGLPPVAMESDLVRRQVDDLKPLIKEHRDYGPTIDRVNDLGNAFEAALRAERPESPARRRSSLTPSKRASIASVSSRKGSLDVRSPGGRGSIFGSRRPSQDIAVHLEELSPVQQQLTEINNRYHLLDMKLSDRQNALDSVKDELRKHLDAINNLRAALDRLARQMPKDSVPQSKEEADKQLRAVRDIQESLYNHQPALDSLRTNCLEMVHKHGKAAGASDLEQQVQDVIEQWSDLHGLCKEKMAFLDRVKEFLELADNFSNWLTSKGKMMSVLGPIATDTRIVENQLQQVQVLRDDFSAHYPQLQHLNKLGESILENLDTGSPEARKVSDKLNAINEQWDQLLGLLDKRQDALSAAAAASKDFNVALNQLQNNLQKLSDEFEDLGPPGQDVDNQLRKLEKLENDLDKQRPLLTEVESLGENLSDILADAAAKNEIRNTLGNVGRMYNQLQRKIENRRAELESSLRDEKELADMCLSLLDWLKEMQTHLSDKLLVSADHEVLKNQVEEYEPIYKEIMSREHEVIMLVNKSQDISSRGSGRDTRGLQKSMDSVQRQWDRLKREAVERHNRLTTCMEQCRKFLTAQSMFLPWLDDVESKLSRMQAVSFKKPDLDRQIKEMQAFKNELSRHSQEYENNKTLGEALLAATDRDKEGVKGDLKDMRDRWDKLNNAVLGRLQALEDVSQRLQDYNDKARDLGHKLQRIEDSVASHDALGDAAKDPKLLNRMKSLYNETRQLEQPLRAVEDYAGALTHEADALGADAHHIQDEVHKLKDKYDQLRQGLQDRSQDLEAAAQAVAQVKEHVKSLTASLGGLEEELESMKPIARDLHTLRKQKDEVEKFLFKTQQKEEELKDVSQLCRDLAAEGYSSNAKAAQEQLSNLEKQLNRLQERGKTRSDDIDHALARVGSFYNLFQAVMGDINDVANEVRNFKPIGGDVDTIRQQKHEFASFRSRRIEPINNQVDACNKQGQGLIQSAASGVNTSAMESDLEKMNEKWNSLKEKLHDRERRLDVGLLQSGKFQEALHGLEKWLTDTEEMVANQKPPSADYKVVKAQLQEQKFLNKMLMDRQNSLNSVSDMGKEIAASAEPMERKQIENQLKDLMLRFDALQNAAKARMEMLEQTMEVAKDFQDKIYPLTDFMEKAEKKIHEMETIPTDEDKIQRLIEEHQILNDDILAMKPKFDETADTATALMSLVGDDDAQMVADKVQDATDRYATLVDESEQLGELLKSSKAGLRHLVLSYEDLLAWLEDMEQRLARFKVLSVYDDTLLQQMDELTELTEEVAAHQKQVDDVVDSGLELMKHISNEEAIQLKDKLDSIQRKYNDLTSKASNLLRHAQEALPLVRRFHKDHGKLNEWLGDAESLLSSMGSTELHLQEKEVRRLENEISQNRSLLESVNSLGPQLCHISPGEGAVTIESLVTKDNRRFEAVCEQVQRRAERIQLSKQRSLEVVNDVDELLEWFREAEGQLQEAEPPSCDHEIIRIQLKEHRALTDDISSQKGRVRDVLAAAKKLLREAPQTEDSLILREKMDDLKETMENVSRLAADRLSILEQALPLAEHFFETHNDLSNWLDEMEQTALVMDSPGLRADQILKQQERNNAMLQAISEHKPLVDKLNKTGTTLGRLCAEEEAAKVQDIMDIDNQRYNALKVGLRERQQALEDAMQETSQFSDKLDGMLSALANTADQVNNAEPISAHPDKIQEQIAENAAILEDLDKRESAYEAVKRAAHDVISKAGSSSDPAVRDIKAKLERLSSLWDHIQDAATTRGQSLEDALNLAERFWDELQGVMRALKDLQETLNTQEPPAVEPRAIQRQQSALKEIKQEIDQTKPEVEQCRKTGQKLMNVCGEPDKPEVKQHIQDLDHAWDNVTALYAKREENLIDAMEKAMEFHDTLQGILDFLDTAEEKFAKLGPLGSDIGMVKTQIKQLKDFKNEVDPHMVKVEALNRQAQELTARTSHDQARRIKEPLADVNARWDGLLKGIVDRQRELEQALLRLGQFQHALDELMVWISRTENTLDGLKPVFGDPAVIEVELAKLKVLVNDIQAHQTSVDTLNNAGRQLIESDKGSEDASVTQQKLNQLNNRWNHLQQKAVDRQRELEDALREAQAFNAEIQDLLLWLGDVDSALSTSKPVGGLPETAKEQLARFMEVFDDLERMRPKVETVLQQGNDYLKRSTEGSASNLQHNLRTLKQRWDNVLNRANDKKIKLEIALKEATEFHEALQEFVDWLTNAEKLLSNLSPVSRVMDTILEQIEEHKAFQKEIGAHREVMLNLDKKGTHLKYFSQKQDVILIKNLLISVQHRWERVVSKSAERTRALDHGYKEAKAFHDAWVDLIQWLDNAQTKLDEITATLGNDPEKIKQLLSKHKEFQRQLGAKQPAYDNTLKMGRALKDKAPKGDQSKLQDMLTELKNKWNAVCNHSVDRQVIQNKLEEALLFSGQFKEAIGALLDWLKKAEKDLSHETPVHGDLDTVMALVEQHKAFENELSKRSSQVSSVQNTAQELLKSASPGDASGIRDQTRELSSLWEKVDRLSRTKASRLADALKQAEELHKAVHMLLEWLSDAEMKLRFAGPLPDTEEETRQQLVDHRKFMAEMQMKEREKDNTIKLAQSIFGKCHPDGVSVIKHWMSIIQSRWEDVSSWAKQREQRLQQHLDMLQDLAKLLEELMRYLNSCENTLVSLESQPLPDDLPIIEQLIQEHQEFMEDMAKRQPDVDRICKPKRVSTTIPPGIKDRKASKASRQASREPETPSRESSPEHDAASRRSRSTPEREKTPEKWPHIGPRFSISPSRKGSKVAGTEPTLKNPRAQELWEKWRRVWMLAWDRQRRLQDKYNHLQEVERLKNFSFEEWRKRFMRWLNHKKSRAMDLFRKMDKDNDGRVLRDPDFIDGIIKSKFPTSRLEMLQVVEIMDRNNDGYIDHAEFLAALRPDWDQPFTEQEQIEDEVQRQVAQCTCRSKFIVRHVGEGRYKFGESQKLRLVRILRSTVMVRVGGGWVALDEFLVKNDPCRAKGRTNVELREQFILPEGGAQSMTPFKHKQPQQSGSASSQSGQRSSPLPTAGPITKIREKTVRSTPMTRASFSAGTSDSLSDSEGFLTRLHQPRKGSSPQTPSRGGSSSRPSSRPPSRGSRPPSRAGSDVSLDSVDGTTPARRGISSSIKRTPSFNKPSTKGSARSSTPTRASSGSTGSLSARKGSAPVTSRTPASPLLSRSRTPSSGSIPGAVASATSTPRSSRISSGTSSLTRKGSGASDIARRKGNGDDEKPRWKM
ncbi:unnamed protein product [Darwinula stevensoni]|uniref:Uncharacterized protein n=1 Tax=Darwinula stevensoni TaxID=69355 RepID=A0A7R8X5R4_9CRUS|nr:unnamed protein product [Darwinula stevensoni]CAG0880401.1 unnamed protein product [Darwinula stevensoni]